LNVLDVDILQYAFEEIVFILSFHRQQSMGFDLEIPFH